MTHELGDEVFRERLTELVARSRLSMRRASAAMGRDPGYVAALLDPSRPSRARPTPSDLLRLSDATGIPFVELLEILWAIPVDRLSAELIGRGVVPSADADLTDDLRREVADFRAFIVARRQQRSRQPNS